MGRQALQERGEALAARLPPLLTMAEQVAGAVAYGTHGRRRAGAGDAFWQFRRYQPGDMVSALDWRRSGKSDRLYIKEREWEVAQTVWLHCDLSPSMAYRSRPRLPEKGDRAALLCLALSALLVRGGERLALLGQSEPLGQGRGALTQLASLLVEALSGDGNTAIGGDPTSGRAASPSTHSQAVLIGDFLQPLEEVNAWVHTLASQGVRGCLLQILDPAEESLPFKGRVRFKGLEGEPAFTAPKAQALRPAYAERMERHRKGLDSIARAAGWVYGRHHTNSPPESALLYLYNALSHGRSQEVSAGGLA